MDSPSARARRLERAEANRQHDLRVVVEDIARERNAESVLRTAEAVGAAVLHVVRREDLRAEAIGGVAKGAQRWLPVESHREPGSCIARLTEAGLRIWCCALDPEAIDFREVDYTQPCAIVLGNETEGASASFRCLADGQIAVPMMGLTQSLNVAAAAAVVLYEVQRQRALAGMYPMPQLDETTRAHAIDRRH